MNTPTPRITYTQYAGGALHGWLAVEKFIGECGIEKTLIDLMKMRASQINGCAYCLDMHATDAFKENVPPIKLLMLDAWEEAPAFTDRERAALAWTEAVTRITDGHVPDAVYDIVRGQFSEKEVVALTVIAAQINTWNRVAISLRVPPAATMAEKLIAA